MTEQALMAPEQIRAAHADNPGRRDRDLAESLGIAEAQLVAAFVGQNVTRISASLDDIFSRLNGLGEVMALTRNPHCVIEKVGQYDNYHSGAHASMVLTEDIDLRMFPSHWVHAFAVERATDKGTQRSLQIFDAAGDAVFCFTFDPRLIETMRAQNSYSFITFGWQENDQGGFECFRVGFSTQSFYLPDKKVK